MPTDYAKLSENLAAFYDFTGKTVLYIGAGSRQLLDLATPFKKLIAVDRDVAALRDLKARVEAEGRQRSVEVVGAGFSDISLRGDVVYFEFCLHELDEPEKALIHARSLAADIVVYDHAPGSEWSYYCAEEDKVARSFAAMERFGIRRRQTFQAQQWFRDYAELLAKIEPGGPLAVERVRKFSGATEITIPMPYGLSLL